VEEKVEEEKSEEYKHYLRKMLNYLPTGYKLAPHPTVLEYRVAS